jgi:hypothetical protein
MLPEVGGVLDQPGRGGNQRWGCQCGSGGLRRFAGRGKDYGTKKTLMAAVGSNLLRLPSHLAANPAATPLTDLLAAWIGALLGPLGRPRPDSEAWSGPRAAGAPRTAAAVVALNADQRAFLSGAC